MKNEVKEFLKNHDLSIDEFSGSVEVGGSLHLGGLTSIPEGFNPTVGGSLYLGGLTSIPEGFNPTVGGYLDLEGLTSIHKKPKSIIEWEGGKYIKVDRIFCEVIRKKGNVRVVKNLNSHDEYYVVSDGNDNYAHGKTINEAKEDLLYKSTNKNISDYNDLTIESVLSFADAITCYRVITRACSFGVREYIENRLPKKKKQFSIKEIIELTKNEYGGDSFKNHFK